MSDREGLGQQRLAYRPAEVAELLGISRSKVYELMHAKNPLPYLRPGGGAVLVPAEALRVWIERQTQEQMGAA
jgi:excisionase family DNA binding protein